MGVVTQSPGALRESIRFETKATVPDGRGGSSSPWSAALAGIPARIQPMLKGGETVINNALQGTAVYNIWVRYSSETAVFDETARIVDERLGTVFNVRLRGQPDERRRFLMFVCQTGTAQ